MFAVGTLESVKNAKPLSYKLRHRIPTKAEQDNP